MRLQQSTSLVSVVWIVATLYLSIERDSIEEILQQSISLATGCKMEVDIDDRTLHNYQRKLFQMLECGVIKPGKVSVCHVYHDRWCGVHSGSLCDCDCEVVVTEGKEH